MAIMRAVEVAELPEIWPQVRHALNELFEKPMFSDLAETDGWILEDVYVALVTRTATLYVDDDEWSGFGVFQAIPHFTQRRLHCWIVHCIKDPKQYVEQVKELARQNKCSVITFESSRRGWQKRAERLGFTPASVNYQMQLGE